MQLDVLVALFCYGGNGGIASLIPQAALWLARTAHSAQQDDRIGRFTAMPFGDTPLPMERNRVVAYAIENKYDVIVMLDSDNGPDLYLGSRPWAEPFWDSSFAFLYDRMLRGLPTVVAAPYCGPPPHPVSGGEESVYVFRAQQMESGDPSRVKIEMYDRQTASQMRGIQPIAAGPTGCIMYSTSAFSLMPIRTMTDEEVLGEYAAGRISAERALRLLRMQSWFFYEYADPWQTRKASTEDVTNTREIQMAGFVKYGEPVVFCNWNSWAAHYKPKCIGMPEPIGMDQVTTVFADAVLSKHQSSESVQRVSFPIPEPSAEKHVCGKPIQTQGPVQPDANLEALTRLVAKAGARRDQPVRIVEIGCQSGETTLALAAGLGPAGGEIYVLGQWEGDERLKLLMENLGSIPSVKLVNDDPVELADKLTEEANVDIILVNGDRTAVCLEAWMKHLSPSGVVCGFGYSDERPEVKQAVDEFCGLAGVRAEVHPHTDLWHIRASKWRKGVQKQSRQKQSHDARSE